MSLEFIESSSVGFSRLNNTLQRERNLWKRPSASLIEPPSSAIDE